MPLSRTVAACCGASPFTILTASAQASVRQRSWANGTLPAMWGVGSTFGAVRNHASAGGGSGLYTSTATRSSSARTRRHSGSCSTTAIRLRRTNNEPVGSASITLASITSSVDGVGGIATIRMSLPPANSTSEPARATESASAAASSISGSNTLTGDP